MFSYIFKILNMNGYGVYVLSCYGLFLALMTWQVVAALKRSVVTRGNLKQHLWSGSVSDPQT
jgi:heme exporter protein CcmD